MYHSKSSYIFFILEDNPQDTELMKRAVSAYFPNAKINTGTRLSDCLSTVKSNPVDMILLDLNLPDSIGYETFQKVKAEFPNIPIFILSVYGNEEIALQAIEDGAADYFSKDYISKQELLGRYLRNAFERDCMFRKLTASERNLLDILNSLLDGILVTDLSRNLLFYNKAAEVLLGSSNLIIDSLCPLKPNLTEEQISPLKPLSKDKSDISISIKTTLSTWNHTPSYYFTLRVLSNDQQITNTLIKSKKQAEISNQTKEAFLANMSHKMRTPLNGIMGAATLLADTSLTKEQLDYVNTLNHSSDFLLTLINDLSTFSKIEKGKAANVLESNKLHSKSHSYNNPSKERTLKIAPQILVAEGQLTDQKLIVTMLKKMGCRVLTANTGAEAIDRATSTAVDLIFIDYQMFGIDGLEVTRRLRKLPQYEFTPIIAMTNFIFPSDIERCFEAGVNDVLIKPFKKADLEQRLLKWTTLPQISIPNARGEFLDENMVKSWKELAADSSDAFEKEFLALFFNTSKEIILEAKTAIQNQDKLTLKRLLHRFKGSAGHLGAIRLANYLEQSELFLNEGNSIPDTLIPTLENEIKHLNTIFNAPQAPRFGAH